MSRRRSQSPVGSDHSRGSRAGGGSTGRSHRDYAAINPHNHRVSHDYVRGPSTTPAAASLTPPPPPPPPTTISTNRGRDRMSSSGSASRPGGSSGSGSSVGGDGPPRIDHTVLEDLLKGIYGYMEREKEARLLEDKKKSAQDWMKKNPGRSDYDDKLRKMEADHRLASDASHAMVEGIGKVLGSILGGQITNIKHGVETNRYQLGRLVKEHQLTSDGLGSLRRTVDRLDADVAKAREVPLREKAVQNAIVDRLRVLEQSGVEDRLGRLERNARLQAVNTAATSGPSGSHAAAAGAKDEAARADLTRQDTQLRELLAKNAKLEARLAALERFLALRPSIASAQQQQQQQAETEALPPPPPPPPSQTPPPLPSQPPPSPPPESQSSYSAAAPGGADSAVKGAEAPTPQDLEGSALKMTRRLVGRRLVSLEERLNSIELELIPTELSNVQADIDAQIDARLETWIENRKRESRKRRKVAEGPENATSDAAGSSAGTTAAMAKATTTATATKETTQNASEEAPGPAQMPEPSKLPLALDSAFSPDELRRSITDAVLSQVLAENKEQALARLAAQVTADVGHKVSTKVMTQLAAQTGALVERTDLHEAIQSALADFRSHTEADFMSGVEQRLRLLLSRPDVIDQLAGQLQQRGIGGDAAALEAQFSSQIQALREDHIGLRDRVKEKLVGFESQLAIDRKKMGRMETQSATQGALFAKFLQQWEPFLAHGPTVFAQVVAGVNRTAAAAPSQQPNNAAMYHLRQQQLHQQQLSQFSPQQQQLQVQQLHQQKQQQEQQQALAYHSHLAVHAQMQAARNGVSSPQHQGSASPSIPQNSNQNTPSGGGNGFGQQPYPSVIPPALSNQGQPSQPGYVAGPRHHNLHRN